jgi:ubiquinone/menaquinone biosynthesis C-methylase UbiE
MKPSFHHRAIARLMRVFFYLLYHQLAWTYNWVAGIVSLGLWKDWIASILPDLKGPRVLELGHGPGHLQAMMHENGIKAFGIDESPQMGKIAARYLRNRFKTHFLIRGYTQYLPFSNHTFHQLVSTFPSEYIIDPNTIAEAFRVLVSGGEFIILPVAWITGQSWMEKSAAWLFRVTGQSQDWEPKILAPFQKAGFQTELKRINHKRWTLLVIICKKG